uniref:Fibrinogen C-terminal domain-containing protein n=1 Tax=Ciona savignyi TaxID=51511 RepID=H2ZAF8_CIOSA
VFQKRVNGTEDFFRGWDDYVSGFGKLDEEFWLGLDTIHNLTKDDEYEMRVDLEDFDGNKSYASYSTFVVSGPPFYSLRVGGYQGTAGHAMISGKFSTKDRDQDTWSSNCAQAYKGGWWYTACHSANLNGLYLRGTHTSYADGVIWRPWKGYYYSLKIAEMKLRIILRKPNWSRGGVYTIFPLLVLSTFQVFQKRVNGTEDFFRGWDDYVSGFGKLDEEFWLGLDTIHNLTKDDEYEMRVDLEDFDGNKSYASYSTFVVSGPPFYSLRVGGYQGTAGHAMRSGNFSTKDRDQDTWSSNCAQAYKGGWWYTACHGANLNGLYLRGTHTSYANGVNWEPWKGYYYSLKIAEMKLRR